MRRYLFAAAGLLAASLATASCSAGADVGKALQVIDVSTGWFDAGIVNGQNKLVPSVTFMPTKAPRSTPRIWLAAAL